MPISIAPSDDGFDIFVHVPLYRADSTMTLFQHLPMPLPLDDDVFLMVDSDSDTIAVSQDNSLYRLTSITELAADCFRIGSFYACPRGNHAIKAPQFPPNNTVDPGLCLWALLQGKGEFAAKSCRRTFIQPGPGVVQISACLLYTSPSPRDRG